YVVHLAVPLTPRSSFIFFQDDPAAVAPFTDIEYCHILFLYDRFHAEYIRQHFPEIPEVADCDLNRTKTVDCLVFRYRTILPWFARCNTFVVFIRETLVSLSVILRERKDLFAEQFLDTVTLHAEFLATFSVVFKCGVIRYPGARP